jgi:catechol 2,3-dioxygenase
LGFNTWLGSDVKPLPPNTAGLRHWTVRLASSDEVAAVRARVDIAGLQAYNHETGLLVRDPWETAVVFSVG